MKIPVAGTVTALILTVIEEFGNDLSKPHTINQLALQTGKAYANIHAAVQKLLKQDILRKKVIGHSHLCQLNLKNDTALLYLTLVQTRKKEQATTLPKKLSAHPDVALIWQREHDLLVITQQPCETFDSQATWMTLDEFTNNKELFATIGQHTLVTGHTFYANLLHREARR